MLLLGLQLYIMAVFKCAGLHVSIYKWTIIPKLHPLRDVGAFHSVWIVMAKAQEAKSKSGLSRNGSGGKRSKCSSTNSLPLEAGVVLTTIDSIGAVAIHFH